jgi:hypothetical protein
MFGIGPAETAILVLCAILFYVVLIVGFVAAVIVIRNNSRRNSPSGTRLAPCPDCGRPLSPLAITCPQCGRPLRT